MIERNIFAMNSILSETTPTVDQTSVAVPAKPRSINHVFFMHVRTTNEWLALTPKDRFAFLENVVRPLLARHPQVTMRFFDSEGFCASVTDVVMWESPEVMAYQAVVEELRETKFWGTYFDVVQIIASIENAYTIHYGVEAF
jgi:Darcynin, domain of unknown function